MKKVSWLLVLIFFLIQLILPISVSGGEDTAAGAQTAQYLSTYNAEEIYSMAENKIFYIRVFRSDGTLQDVGTGFVISESGLAVTAYHVVENAHRIEGVFSDGNVATSLTVLVSDITKDAALLQLTQEKKVTKENKAYSFFKLRTEKVRHGEKVFAMGYPIKNTAIITEGIINTPSAQVNGKDRILASAEVAGGMSGGPVIDQYGNVVGVISGSFYTMNNIHFIINMDDINKLLTTLERK